MTAACWQEQRKSESTCGQHRGVRRQASCMYSFLALFPLFLLLLLNLCASLGAVVESHSTCVFSHADAHQFSAPCLQPCITRVR